jgi:hypothetical protein
MCQSWLVEISSASNRLLSVNEDFIIEIENFRTLTDHNPDLPNRAAAFDSASHSRRRRD